MYICKECVFEVFDLESLELHIESVHRCEEQMQIETIVNISQCYSVKKCEWAPWFEPQQRRPKNIKTARHTIRRNDKLTVSNTLPVIVTTQPNTNPTTT